MSLEIELRRLTEGTNKIEWTPSSSELDLSEEDLGMDGPTKVILNLIKAGGSLVAHGEIAFHLRLACCRCLEPIHRDVETAVDLIFQKGTKETLDDLEEAGDTDVIPYEENAVSVDISPQIRDAIILETPVKPLCSESCPGLCPVCGANRNSESCSCIREEVDPRWDALRKFKEEQES